MVFREMSLSPTSFRGLQTRPGSRGRGLGVLWRCCPRFHTRVAGIEASRRCALVVVDRGVFFLVRDRLARNHVIGGRLGWLRETWFLEVKRGEIPGPTEKLANGAKHC